MKFTELPSRVWTLYREGLLIGQLRERIRFNLYLPTLHLLALAFDRGSTPFSRTVELRY